MLFNIHYTGLDFTEGFKGICPGEQMFGGILMSYTIDEKILNFLPPSV